MYNAANSQAGARYRDSRRVHAAAQQIAVRHVSNIMEFANHHRPILVNHLSGGHLDSHIAEKTEAAPTLTHLLSVHGVEEKMKRWKKEEKNIVLTLVPAVTVS